MKISILIVILFFSSFGISQNNNDSIKEIEEYQASENEEFSNSETTILDSLDFKDFKALEFYPIDLKYRIEAKFIRTPNEKPFLMPTTTDRLPEYVKYGEAHFTIDDKPLKLALYKSTKPYDDPKYKDYLFLPFTDYTSGDGSYGGGRFLDTWIPDGDIILLDFNKSYNPYCAYNKRYSCPIPPKENDLLVRIEAGVKDFVHH